MCIVALMDLQQSFSWVVADIVDTTQVSVGCCVASLITKCITYASFCKILEIKKRFIIKCPTHTVKMLLLANATWR